MIPLDDDLPAILAMTAQAVAIDSGTYCTAGVQAVAELFAGHLRGSGFAVTMTPLPGRADQMTATRVFGPGQRVLVLGHADTVWPDGTAAGWGFGNDGTFLTGPGVGDMKVNVAMALHALRHVAAAPPPGIGAITVLIVPDEEIGSPGSRAWIEAPCPPGRRLPDARTLPSRRQPGRRPRRGRGAVRPGRGRHGPCRLRPRPRGLGHHCPGGTGRPAGGVDGRGSRRRRLGRHPARRRRPAGRPRPCRAAPGPARRDLGGRGLAGGRSARHRRRAAGRPPRADHGGRRVLPPALPDRAGHPAAVLPCAQALCAELSIPVGEVVSPGGSDGSFAAALGIPTLDGLGPVCHDTCSRRERVELDSIVPRGKLFAGLIAAIGREGVA